MARRSEPKPSADQGADHFLCYRSSNSAREQAPLFLALLEEDALSPTNYTSIGCMFQAVRR